MYSYVIKRKSLEKIHKIYVRLAGADTKTYQSKNK